MPAAAESDHGRISSWCVSLVSDRAGSRVRNRHTHSVPLSLNLNATKFVKKYTPVTQVEAQEPGIAGVESVFTLKIFQNGEHAILHRLLGSRCSVHGYCIALAGKHQPALSSCHRVAIPSQIIQRTTVSRLLGTTTAVH